MEDLPETEQEEPTKPKQIKTVIIIAAVLGGLVLLIGGLPILFCFLSAAFY